MIIIAFNFSCHSELAICLSLCIYFFVPFLGIFPMLRLKGWSHFVSGNLELNLSTTFFYSFHYLEKEEKKLHYNG